MGSVDLIIHKVFKTLISYGTFLNSWNLENFLTIFLRKAAGLERDADISATPQPNTANIRIFLFVLELSTELN